MIFGRRDGGQVVCPDLIVIDVFVVVLGASMVMQRHRKLVVVESEEGRVCSGSGGRERY